MTIASSFEPFDRQEVFYDLGTLEAMFGNAVKDNPRLAEPLAWLLYRVVREMAEGEKGRQRVVNTMKLGVEWLYQYTEAHKLSFTAFLYQLEGVLIPSEAPEELTKRVIEAAEARATPDADDATDLESDDQSCSAGVPEG